MVGKPPNEDAVGHEGDLAYVIDGASGLGASVMRAASSDARWLVDLTAQYLNRCGDDPRSLRRIVRDLIDEVREATSSFSFPYGVPPSAALGMVRLRDDWIEYLLLADVTIAFAGEPPVVRTEDAVERKNHGAFDFFRTQLEETGSHAAARELAWPLQVQHRQTRMNRRGGYWVLSNDRRAARKAQVGRVPRAGVSSVLLCTDGFARAWDQFGLFECEDVLVRRTSLADVAQRLREAEHADPETRRVPRWSVYDDAAALMIAPGQN